jgi:predicted DNA-binding protein
MGGRKSRRAKGGRPKMFEEPLKLANFRLPTSLLKELAVAQHALGKSSLADLVREALRKYLEENEAAIRAYKRLRDRHS